MTRILIIEDEKKIVELLRSYLEAEHFEVTWTASGADGLEMATDSFDLVLLDLMLPDMPGEEVCKRLRRQSEVPVIMLTARSSEEERVRGLGLGADDYVVKPFSPRELVLRIKAILKRTERARDRLETAGDSGGIFSFNNGELRVNEGRHEVTFDGADVTLTPVEFKALMSMIRNRGLVLSRAQLIDAVYGYSFEGYDRTVDAHIKNLRRKIESNPRKPRFIQTVYGVGYKFTGEPDAD